MAFFFRPVVQQAGLRRADVPGADKGPLEALQPAAGGAGIAAVVALPADKLPFGDRDTGQAEKEKIPEIGPYPGPPAADVRAVGAGPMAQVFHERKEGFQQAPDLPGLHAAIGQGPTIVAYGSRQTGVGFTSQANGVPWDCGWEIFHHHGTESRSTTSRLDITREQSSHRSRSGSMVVW